MQICVNLWLKEVFIYMLAFSLYKTHQPKSVSFLVGCSALLASFINRPVSTLYVWLYEQAYDILSLPYREMQKYNLAIMVLERTLCEVLS